MSKKTYQPVLYSSPEEELSVVENNLAHYELEKQKCLSQGISTPTEIDSHILLLTDRIKHLKEYTE